MNRLSTSRQVQAVSALGEGSSINATCRMTGLARRKSHYPWTKNGGQVIARLTCPVVLASFYFHFGVGFYWVLLANAAMYALVGLIVETLRQQLNHAK